MRRRNIDWFALVPVILLLCVGLIMVLSASSPITVNAKSKDAYSIFNKQLTWVAVGFAVMYITSNYNYRKLQKYTNISFVLTVILLLAVLAFPPINGARSWIIVGGSQFQPSEFVKLCLILILSKMMSSRNYKNSSFTEGVMPAVLIIGVVCGLILIEPDLGTAVVIALTSFVMLFVGGSRYRHLGAMAAAGMALVAAAVVVAPYRFDRWLAFIDPFKDPLGTGYQITQSLYAIGSGGLLGVGLGRSMQKFYWIPEQHTDFIFSILSEELGFIGAVSIILLFIFFAARGFNIARRSRDSFGMLLACGLTSSIVLEAIINIAVVTSSMPVTGITLPFISYGGSSLIFKMAAVGVILNISRFPAMEDAAFAEYESGHHQSAIRYN